MPGSFLVKNDTAEWDRLIDINIKGVLYGIGAVLPHMRERKRGHIINISSVAAHHDPMPGVTVYCMTKHAVRLISQGLRMEEMIAGNAVRVTDIAPGKIDTDLKHTVTDPEMRALCLDSYREGSLAPEHFAEAVSTVLNLADKVVIQEMMAGPMA